MTASQSRNMPSGSHRAHSGERPSGCYRIFDSTIRSQIPLPELREESAREPQITVSLEDSDTAEEEGFVDCHDWRDHGGRLLCRAARRDDEYRLLLPQRASFRIGRDGAISCVPAPAVEQGLLRHLLLNQVLPRYLAHTGEFLLHASAVTLANGNTVAFLGESGHGKSTLAYFCQKQGANIVDDDCILVRAGERGVLITGGAPTLRLYPDSLQALGHEPAAFAIYTKDSEKQQMSLARHNTPGSRLQPLHALFLLDAPRAALADTAVRIDAAAGQDAMMAILRGAFSLDPSDPETMARTFRRAAQALEQGLRVFQLHYPRQHAALPQVLQALLNHR